MRLVSEKNISLMEPTAASTQTGRIVSISGRDALVALLETTEPAQVAFSCLVQPTVGDLVLCAKSETGLIHIIAIIERPEKQNMCLSFPTDTTLLSESGSITLSSNESINLASGNRLTCIADKTVHKSREAVVAYEEVTATGSTLQANFKTVRLISKLVNTLAVNVIEKVKTYIRHTEDYDQIKAGQMTRKTEGLYAVDSKHTVMVSKKDTKIDGERIHMG
ncbi:MAG: DUF3540 domain-containing protein [bacterium]